MADGDKYRTLIQPIGKVIDIYGTPDVFLSTLGQVSREAGLIYAGHWCQSEVCNGGFDQFFFNSTGVLAPEAVEGSKAIGQGKISDLVRQATALFGTPYIRQREARQATLDALPPDIFKELDAGFWTLIGSENGGFEVAADIYASSIKI